jgi:hypothetical protein
VCGNDCVVQSDGHGCPLLHTNTFGLHLGILSTRRRPRSPHIAYPSTYAPGEISARSDPMHNEIAGDEPTTQYPYIRDVCFHNPPTSEPRRAPTMITSNRSMLLFTARLDVVYASEKVTDQRYDLVEIGFQRPVAAVERMQLSIRQVAQIGPR